MARKSIDVTIPFEGRDKGKVFHIVEMPSLHSERWAMRAIKPAPNCRTAWNWPAWPPLLLSESRILP
jgi:hypothetical protein